MQNCKKQNSITKILGHKVNLSKIRNSTLKQILDRSFIKGFLFGYEDKSHTEVGRKYSEAYRERYSDKTYYDHREHNDNHRDVWDSKYHTEVHRNLEEDTGSGRGHSEQGYSEWNKQDFYR